jgi:hypothetical protein
MATGQFDKTDIALFTAFGLSAAVTLGIATVELYGFTLSDTAFTLGSNAIQISTLITLGALAFVYLTNESSDLASVPDSYRYITIGAIGVSVGLAVAPDTFSVLTQNDTYALLTFAAQATAYGVISYMA